VFVQRGFDPAKRNPDRSGNCNRGQFRLGTQHLEPVPNTGGLGNRRGGADMTLQQILRVTRLINRYGMTPAQAAMVAGLAWGEV
jgi:hypothetical protein